MEDSCSTVSAEFHFSKGNSELLMWVDYIVEMMIRRLAQQGFSVRQVKERGKRETVKTRPEAVSKEYSNGSHF